jgi:hypothetical protein
MFIVAINKGLNMTILSTEIQKDLATINFLAEIVENDIMDCLVCDGNGWKMGVMFLDLIGITRYELNEAEYIVEEVFYDLNELFMEYGIDRNIGYADGGIFLEPVTSEVWEF